MDLYKDEVAGLRYGSAAEKIAAEATEATEAMEQ
jgi:hypothetical protein